VRKLAGVRGEHAGVGVQREDGVERAGNAVGIARVLDARRVGEQLALAADRRLDRIGREHAGKTDKSDDRTEQGGRRAGAAFFVGQAAVRPGRAVDHLLAALSEPAQPGKNAGEPQVEGHVPVQDMAVFVAHDSLQLVARELLQSAMRHDDGGLVRRIARHQGVHRVFPFEDVHRRHRNRRGDRHFFDDVDQAAFRRRAFPGIDIARAEHMRDCRAAFPQLPCAVRRDRENDAANGACHRDDRLDRHARQRCEVGTEQAAPFQRRPARERQRAVEREQRVDERAGGAVARHNCCHGGEIPQHQPPRVSARELLLCEKIERGGHRRAKRYGLSRGRIRRTPSGPCAPRRIR
jgi:hypothetical protein